MSESIGNRIRRLREAKEWSQREFAERVGINYSVINRIELDKRPVKDHEISKIADVFSVSTDYLVGKTEMKNGTSKDEINTAFYDYDNLDKFSDEEVLKLQEKIFEELKRRSRSKEK